MKNKFRASKPGKETALGFYFQNLSARLKITPEPFLFDTEEIQFSTRFIVNGFGKVKTIQKAKLN